LTDFVVDTETDVHEDDAVVMYEILRGKIRDREERRKNSIRKRRTVQKPERIHIEDIEPVYAADFE
jgi:hypothetical protein